MGEAVPVSATGGGGVVETTVTGRGTGRRSGGSLVDGDGGLRGPDLTVSHGPAIDSSPMSINS